MSRMNAAWSNEPPWAEAVPAIFKKPMTIAFGGALLAHAIFFLGLPVVAGTEKQPDVQPVATTVLTPEEKALIPPDVSQTALSTGSIGSLLPNNSGLTMPPLPSGGSTAPGSNFGFGTLDQPSFSDRNNSTGSNSSSDSDINKRLDEAKQQQQEAARQEKIKQTEIAKNQRDEKEDKERAKKAPSVNPGAMPPGTETGSPPPQPPTPTPPTPQTPPKPSRPPNAEIIAKAPSLYVFEGKETGPTLGSAVQTKAYEWATQSGSRELEIYNNGPKGESQFTYPKVHGDPNIRQSLPYSIQIDDRPIAIIDGYAQKVKEGYGTAIVGFAVDGQGKLIPEPKIIQSTGYAILDEYAISHVRSRVRNFRVTGTAKLYLMTIPIDPPAATSAPAPAS